MINDQLSRRLESLKTQVEGVQKAPLLTKAQMAEQALISAYYLLESMAERIQALECDEYKKHDHEGGECGK